MTRRQCKKCPWRKDVDPFDIPNGYCVRKHEALASTIATPGAIDLGAGLQLMACHESNTLGREKPCVGWLVNQIGPGNNIALRLAAIAGRVNTDVRVVGEQHARFEDTLPSSPRSRVR